MSETTEFSSPGSPFSESNDDLADKTWQSSVTGNIISFRSSCGSKSTPDMNSVPSLLMAELDRPDIVEKKSVKINNRNGLSLKISGFTEGVPIIIHAVTFVKYGCSYLLTYVGTKEKSNIEIEHFKTFVKNFEVK